MLTQECECSLGGCGRGVTDDTYTCIYIQVETSSERVIGLEEVTDVS